MTEHGTQGPPPPDAQNPAEFYDPDHDFFVATDRAATLHHELIGRLLPHEVRLRALDKIELAINARRDLPPEELEVLHGKSSDPLATDPDIEYYYGIVNGIEDSARTTLEDIDGFVLRTVDAGKVALERNLRVDKGYEHQTVMYSLGSEGMMIRKAAFMPGQGVDSTPDFEAPTIADVVVGIDQLTAAYQSMLDLDDETLRQKYVPEA
jgi:hypothetical protein